jgi:Uma2 family endonuclease
MITQVPVKNDLMTLDQFLDWYPDGFGIFELHKGIIVEMQPTGTHEQVVSFLNLKLGIKIKTLKLPYLASQKSWIKLLYSDNSAYIPDITIIDKNALKDEPMWNKNSTLIQGKTIKLVIEVVSTNWQNDYSLKVTEYEKLGIAEYWIIDYLGLGGKRFIGDPKQPTISIYQLVDDEYIVSLYRGGDRLKSLVFPDLNLTPEQIFNL